MKLDHDSNAFVNGTKSNLKHPFDFLLVLLLGLKLFTAAIKKITHLGLREISTIEAELFSSWRSASISDCERSRDDLLHGARRPRALSVAVAAEWSRSRPSAAERGLTRQRASEGNSRAAASDERGSSDRRLSLIVSQRVGSVRNSVATWNVDKVRDNDLSTSVIRSCCDGCTQVPSIRRVCRHHYPVVAAMYAG